jgi:hypothetical protein
VSTLAETFDKYLPYPVYEFRGGPVDGQKLKVDLIDLGEEKGLIAPDFWHVSAPDLSLRVLEWAHDPFVMNRKVFTATYRFVRTIGYRNVGYYKFVDN